MEDAPPPALPCALFVSADAWSGPHELPFPPARGAIMVWFQLFFSPGSGCSALGPISSKPVLMTHCLFVVPDYSVAPLHTLPGSENEFKQDQRPFARYLEGEGGAKRGWEQQV